MADVWTYFLGHELPPEQVTPLHKEIMHDRGQALLLMKEMFSPS